MNHNKEDLTWQQQAADFILPEMKGFFDGVTLGGSTELGAAAESVAGPQFSREMAPGQYDLLEGDTYQDAYERYSQAIDGQGSFGSEILGAAAGGLATGAAAASAGAGRLGFLGLAAAEGAAAGALGSGQDDRRQGAVKGMIFGLVGGILPALGVKTYEFLRGVFYPGQNNLRNTLKQLADGGDISELTGNPEMVIGDLTPALQNMVGKVARDSPQAQKAMVQVLGDRMGTTLNRFSGYLNQAFKPKLDSTGIEAVNAARQEFQKPMYNRVFKPGGEPLYVSSDSALRTKQMSKFLDSSAFNDSVNGMLHRYNDPYGIPAFREVQGEGEEPVREYSLAFIANIVDELGERGDNFFRGARPSPKKGMRYSSAADEGRGAVESAQPEWKIAQSYAGQTIRMRNAFQTGKDAIKDGMGIRELKDAVKEIRESQAQWVVDKDKYGFGAPLDMDDAMEAFRSGFAEGLYENIMKRNVNFESLKGVQEVLLREKMNTFMPKFAVDRLVRDMKKEMRYMATAKFADKGGGLTGDIGGQDLDDFVTAVRTGLYTTPWALLEAAQKMIDKTRGPGKVKFQKALGDALMSNDPSIIEKALDKQMKASSNLIPRLFSSQKGTAPTYEGDE